MRAESATPYLVRWSWGLWTVLGLVFAIQLHWYHQIPWATSLYWGLTDWYLWGLLALGLVLVDRALRTAGLDDRQLLLVLAAAAPAVIAMHVILTILVGWLVTPPHPQGLFAEFRLLFAKKLTLNLITYAALVTALRWLSKPAIRSDNRIRGCRAHATRFLRAGEIMTIEAAGNYVNLIADDGSWMVRNSLTAMHKRLGERQFLRISRSKLVNAEYIRGTRDTSPQLVLCLSDGTEVIVAKRRRAAVRRALRKRFDD